MGNATKSTNLFIRYISDVCRYDIGDYSGSNNRVVNIVDAAVYLVYLGITIFVLWLNGINTLPFIATVLLIMRSFLKYLRMCNKLRKDGDNIAISFIGRMIVYAVVLVFISVVYGFVADKNAGKVVLTICYAFFALFELTDIIADCYNAVPRLYRH